MRDPASVRFFLRNVRGNAAVTFFPRNTRQVQKIKKIPLAKIISAPHKIIFPLAKIIFPLALIIFAPAYSILLPTNEFRKKDLTMDGLEDGDGVDQIEVITL